MSKASDWLREERRKTLGDWVAVCLDCGHAQRYFADDEKDLPTTCPTCSGPVRARCPACEARFASVFTVACESCGEPVRDETVTGIPIRRPDGEPRTRRRR